MTPFALVAILMSLVALAGWANGVTLKLPHGVAMMLAGIIGALAVFLLQWLAPELALVKEIASTVSGIDFTTTVTGYMLGCRYAIPHMIAGGGGSIVNTASNSGTAGDLARIAYGATKGAIITLTRYVATQHGAQNIRCNAVLPGLFLTPQARKMMTPKQLSMIQRHVILPRPGVPVGKFAGRSSF